MCGQLFLSFFLFRYAFPVADFEFILYNKNVRQKNACILYCDEVIKKRVLWTLF